MGRILTHPGQLVLALQRIAMRRGSNGSRAVGYVEALRDIEERRPGPTPTVFEEKIGIRLPAVRVERIACAVLESLGSAPYRARRLAVLWRLAEPEGQDVTLADLARIHGVTVNAIRQDEALLLGRMREVLENPQLERFVSRPVFLCRSNSGEPNALAVMLEREKWYRVHRNRLAPLVERVVDRVRREIAEEPSSEGNPTHKSPEHRQHVARVRTWILDGFLLAKNPASKDAFQRAGDPHRHHLYWVYRRITEVLQARIPEGTPARGDAR